MKTFYLSTVGVDEQNKGVKHVLRVRMPAKNKIHALLKFNRIIDRRNRETKRETQGIWWERKHIRSREVSKNG